MEIFVKTVEEMTAAELLKIMQERVAVFVVEQQCPYQEADDADDQALHVWLKQDEELIGYTRIIDKGETISIGRVLTPKAYRGKGFGKILMEKTLEEADSRFPGLPIIIGAQEYATDFYRFFGFEVISEVYLEDDIPHVDMKREKSI